MIETLRDQKAEYKEVDRACASGDKVNVDFEGFVDGTAFDGGKAEASDIILGAGSMIPGFEEGILGSVKGELKEINVTFPDEYQSKELEGKEALFKIKLNSVSEAEKPELNDQFFIAFGV